MSFWDDGDDDGGDDDDDDYISNRETMTGVLALARPCMIVCACVCEDSPI